eukprot:6462038-Amphidinium_carterae.1
MGPCIGQNNAANTIAEANLANQVGRLWLKTPTTTKTVPRLHQLQESRKVCCRARFLQRLFLMRMSFHNTLSSKRGTLGRLQSADSGGRCPEHKILEQTTFSSSVEGMEGWFNRPSTVAELPDKQIDLVTIM